MGNPHSHRTTVRTAVPTRKVGLAEQPFPMSAPFALTLASLPYGIGERGAAVFRTDED